MAEGLPSLNIFNNNNSGNNNDNNNNDNNKKENYNYNSSNDNDNNYEMRCPGYDIKLHPVVEFRRGRMRLPFATTTSRQPLGHLYYYCNIVMILKYSVFLRNSTIYKATTIF